MALQTPGPKARPESPETKSWAAQLPGLFPACLLSTSQVP